MPHPKTTTRPEAATPLCPATRVFDLIAHKWTLNIVRSLELAGGPIRFRTLQRAVGAITPKELTKRLRELERGGRATRTIYAEVPPRVEYALTPLGASLGPALAGLHDWAVDHGAQVDANRCHFDERGRAAAGGLIV